MELKSDHELTIGKSVPDSWRTKPLGEIVDFLDGQRRPVNISDRAKMSGEIPYYGASGVVDHVNNYLFDEELILLGEDGENILSRTSRLAFKISGKTWVNNHAHVLRPRDEVVLDYLVDYLESLDYTNYNTGTAQPKLNKLICSQIPVLLPPLTEQRKIASTVGDVGNLLVTLDALVTKKRNLKQAIMQRLLTSQTRLPGFGGAWKEVSLGKHLRFLRNGIHSRAELLTEGTTKYIHYGDIHGSNEVAWDIANKEMPYLPSTMSRGLDHLEDGDVIFADASEDMTGVGKSVEVFGLRNQEAVSGLHTIAVRFDKSVLADGFKSYLQFMPPFRHHLHRLVAGTKVYSTNRAHISTCEIALPGIDEQIAIAQILSDINAELAAIEARRDKTRLLKLGMMLELLTGKTRLVPHA